MALQKCVLNRNRDLKELQPQGTLEFPCAAYESSHTDQAADMIPWHWHEELEIIYLKTGALKLQIPSMEYTLRCGNLAILNSGLLHYLTGEPYGELQSFVFSPFLLTGTSTSSFYQKYLHPLIVCPGFQLLQTDDSCLKEAFQIAFDAVLNDSFAYEFTVREQLSKIMLFCFRELENQLFVQNSPQNSDALRISKMLEYIQVHYAESVTLRAVSGAAGLGERECLRCFKRTIKESPIQYLLKYRLMQSCEMLLSSPSLSIAEIASACGFDHPSYYSQQFKRFYQCTPREYREQQLPDRQYTP